MLKRTYRKFVIMYERKDRGLAAYSVANKILKQNSVIFIMVDEWTPWKPLTIKVE